LRQLFLLLVVAWMQAPPELRVLQVSKHEDGIVEFERPPAASSGPYLGLSMNGSVTIEVQDQPGGSRPGPLRGRATPVTSAPVLFVLSSPQLPALSMRNATAVAAGVSLRVVAARAAGAQTYLVGPGQGRDIVRPRAVAARVYVDGTTGLTYLLVSGTLGDLPCPSLAVLYDVTGELRLLARRASCDA
jgi:hypothetical protein